MLRQGPASPPADHAMCRYAPASRLAEDRCHGSSSIPSNHVARKPLDPQAGNRSQSDPPSSSEHSPCIPCICIRPERLHLVAAWWARPDIQVILGSPDARCAEASGATMRRACIAHPTIGETPLASLSALSRSSQMRVSEHAAPEPPRPGADAACAHHIGGQVDLGSHLPW